MSCEKSCNKNTSVFKSLKAGEFRDRVQIQRPVLARGDGQGGYNEQWADLATVWACVHTISASAAGNIEKFEEMQLKYQQHYDITIRYGLPEPIDNSYRIIYRKNGQVKVLAIISVVNLDMLNWEIDLRCREGGNIG